MATATTPPHLLRLGRFIAAQRWETLPEDTRRAARCQILNMVAALHASRAAEGTRAVTDGLAAFSGAGRSTVLANGRKVPPADAALANAAFAMAHDFDDIVWMGHTCHSAVFAPLAVAEHEARSTRALVTAVVVANEIAGRIGASSFLGPLNGQMWTFIHLAGAAAATASLLELDAEHAAHALAIALAQPNFALQPGFMRPTSKLLAASTPTAAGIQAAYFARAGMTGALDLLEDPRGFWKRFSFLPLPGMLDGLGEFWAMQTLTVKTFPGCHYFQTACSAVEALRARLGDSLDEGNVRAVRVDTTKMGAEVTRFAGDYAAPSEREPIAPVNVNFDLGTTIAIMLHAGRLTAAEMDGAWLAEHSAAIHRLRARVQVHHDPALTATVVTSARAVGAGRAALAGIGPGALGPLMRRYRDEYRSTLISGEELIGWARLAGRRLLGSLSSTTTSTPPVVGGAVPLPFPNRVTIELADGRRESEQVDLPVGSFAAAGMEQALARKVLDALGARGPELLDAGRSIESQSLDAFVALATA